MFTHCCVFVSPAAWIEYSSSVIISLINDFGTVIIRSFWIFFSNISLILPECRSRDFVDVEFSTVFDVNCSICEKNSSYEPRLEKVIVSYGSLVWNRGGDRQVFCYGESSKKIKNKITGSYGAAEGHHNKHGPWGKSLFPHGVWACPSLVWNA